MKQNVEFKIAEDLSLPVEAVTQKLAFLGRTGSGKSYASTKLAELMLQAKAQIVVLDPVGVWWGLRSGTEGFSIPVFGGLHGDIPLEPTSGAMLADLIVNRGISAVLDVSQMMPGEQAQFAFRFAQIFFQRKKAHPSAVHVFIEESQEFVPQNIGGGRSGFEAQMLGAFERLIKLGRNFGIGVSLISQRPQEVNKKALNQTECLFAFQMTGPQERKAIESWVSTKGGDEDIVDTLPRLEVGQPHVWSPQWLRVSKTIRIAKKLTDDVSITPRLGAKPAKPQELSEIELQGLRDLMAKTIEDAKANDPAELKRELAKVKEELQTTQRRFAATEIEIQRLRDKPTEAISIEDKQILREAKLWITSGFVERLEGAQRRFAEVITEATAQAKKAAVVVGKANANMPTDLHSSHSRPPAPKVERPALQSRTVPTPAGDLSLNATQQRILDALAWYRSIGEDNPTVLQVGAIALIDATGGHFSNTVGPLSSNGLIIRGNGTITLTEQGTKYANLPKQVATLADYHDVLRERVRKARSASNKTVEMLNVVIRRGGGEVTAEEIGREVGIDHTGGHFTNTIGPLGTLGLVKRARGIVTPTEIVFPPGLV